MSDIGELEFLASYDATRYPRPSVAVDVVLLTVEDLALKALLVQRTEMPARGAWMNPGGFVGIDERLEDAAARVLRTKAGLEGVFVEQLFTFGDPARDPRTRVISVAYYALVEAGRLHQALAGDGPSGRAITRIAADDAGGTCRAVGADGVDLVLAFDHAQILRAAVDRVRGKLDYADIGFELLPETFTLLELRRAHEAILGRPLNKDSFRRRILDRGLVEATGKKATGLGHRPAERYRFARRSRRSATRATTPRPDRRATR